MLALHWPSSFPSMDGWMIEIERGRKSREEGEKRAESRGNRARQNKGGDVGCREK